MTNWAVELLGCRTNGLQDYWVVSAIACRTTGFYDQLVVGLLGCRTNGLQDYWVVRLLDPFLHHIFILVLMSPPNQKPLELKSFPLRLSEPHCTFFVSRTTGAQYQWRLGLEPVGLGLSDPSTTGCQYNWVLGLLGLELVAPFKTLVLVDPSTTSLGLLGTSHSPSQTFQMRLRVCRCSNRLRSIQKLFVALSQLPGLSQN